MTLTSNKKISKFLSYVLRHKPSSIGLSLDEHGWANIDKLLDCAAKHGHELSLSILKEVVSTSDKQRFSISEDGQRIRANQGHSLNIDLDLKATHPPKTLYHGTAKRFLDAILQEGLTPQQRHHVHLSKDTETALKVGGRHGKPVILHIEAGRMHLDGHQFYCSVNGVWLTDAVPPEYFAVIEDC